MFKEGSNVLVNGIHREIRELDSHHILIIDLHWPKSHVVRSCVIIYCVINIWFMLAISKVDCFWNQQRPCSDDLK